MRRRDRVSRYSKKTKSRVQLHRLSHAQSRDQGVTRRTCHRHAEDDGASRFDADRRLRLRNVFTRDNKPLQQLIAQKSRRFNTARDVSREEEGTQIKKENATGRFEKSNAHFERGSSRNSRAYKKSEE